MISNLATLVAARGSWLLVAGLVVGLAVPELAQKMRPAVEPMVVALLFLAVLRMGPGGLRVGRNGLSRAVRIAGLLQLLLPLGVTLLLMAAGLLEHPLALAAILILAAAPITGAAHFAVMVGGDPALAAASRYPSIRKPPLNPNPHPTEDAHCNAWYAFTPCSRSCTCWIDALRPKGRYKGPR